MARILVVDDQAIFCELFACALARAGHETTIALGGREALRVLQQGQSDLVLLDLNMPSMDGITTLKAIRSNPIARNIPVILLTGVSDRTNVVAAAKLGISSYVLKASCCVKDAISRIQEALVFVKNDSSSDAVAERHAKISGEIVNSLHTSPPGIAVSSGWRTVISIDGSPVDLNSIKPILSRGEVNSYLDQANDVMGFSPSVAEVLRLTANNECSIEQIARVISFDQTIALKLLKLANSTIYEDAPPVDNVLKAVLRIGLAQIREIVMNLAVMDQFASCSNSKCIDARQFWEHSIATGIIAAGLIPQNHRTHASRMFAMGLLHDIGKMVLMEQLGHHYSKVITTARESNLPLELVERRMLGCTHASMMEAVFKRWKFPHEFFEPIQYHDIDVHKNQREPLSTANDKMLLVLANRLAHALLLGSGANEIIYPTDDLVSMLGIESSIITKIEEITHDETDKIKFALLSHSSKSPWPNFRDLVSDSLSAPLNPIYVSPCTPIDAHRIFCEQLVDKNHGEQPNLGIIYLRDSNDNELISKQFLEVESSRKCGRLPLLIISPAKRLEVDWRLVDARVVRTLNTPFSVNQFIKITAELMSSKELIRQAA